MIINDTLRFVLPMLYSTKYNNQFFFNDYFLGAYLCDVSYPEMDDKLLLAYKLFPDENFMNFEDEIKNVPGFYATYVYELDDIIVFVFDIPERFTEDYKLFNNGGFTAFSPELKLNIAKMWDLKTEDELQKVIVGTSQYNAEPFDKQILIIDDYGNTEYISPIEQMLQSIESDSGSVL